MNNKLLELISSKSTEIAEKLQIATTQVYGKLLWYVKIDGIRDLITYGFAAAVFAIMGILAHKFCKKERLYDEPIFLVVYGGSIIISFAIITIFIGIINSMFKIFFPEYYLINQVIEGFSQQ